MSTKAVAGDLADLEARIGHVFADRSQLVRALTHISALAPSPTLRRTDCYQRLEFLGDRVLGLVIASLLCAHFPEAEEGELSRRLAVLVRKETCADIAREWGAGDFLRLGDGEAQNGGKKKSALLGDICESIIGAVYLDGGFPAAQALVERAFIEKLRNPTRPLRDPKTMLQEWAQARGLTPPLYKLAARSGPDHAPVFVIAVTIPGFDPVEARGGSKRAAEQAAAQNFLAREGVTDLT
ncbi:RNAse III [Rhodoblastus acidophilus]|uniref:Ribonuclease 3 n=1 Tax=Rhodoblastus acidophilus TaxID=1074 RepID=A0A212RGZ2_RHOAC|nr:ribonuclease III [Rhodoblastus acidophilus]MCW2316932.1 ribonuclease-3 [Rhodoblastus acidophilus]PPQ39602.1 ribonuclease III [Rhodoblastus acidophilus]RAI24385.1 ribonuclease III [Rhodoblastus acidophilus]SNB71465.1 RNAse III [Rhodoblastus acidophilus]